MNPQQISIAAFDYDLPEDRIAMQPLAQRDASKLLIYKGGNITETVFSKLDQFLPEKTLLVFNNTKVINARIKFKKETGAAIEIFCLEPAAQIKEYGSAMSATQPVQWKCFVGGAAKWKEEVLEKRLMLGNISVMLKAKKIARLTDSYIIEFDWSNLDVSFAEIISAAGNVPLPPYIKRSADENDTNRYQTIFAQHDGSVAAPTAGLHFTEQIFEKLAAKNINKAYVTLHVGAGTFKPVKAHTMAEHDMHAEYIDVNIETISALKKNIDNIAAVGTTSLRTIESLYWLGVKLHADNSITDPELSQWEVYEEKLSTVSISAEAALEALLLWMQQNNRENIFTKTQILIAPGYKFRMAKVLITNFHQPRSTLLLLVAAAIGDDWKKMYDHALKNNFRFLSYGDSNLIFIKAENKK